MTKKLIYTLILLFPLMAFSQLKDEGNSSLQIAKKFISELSSSDTPVDVILSEHVTVKNPGNELYDYLEVSLQEIRINLLSKNPQELAFKYYQELPKKEVRDIDPEGKDVRNMIFVYHKNRLLTSLYIENEKIASFTLVSKGNELAHFVTY